MLVGDLVCVRELGQGVVLDWGEVEAVRPAPSGGEVLVRWRGTRRASWQRVDDPRLQPWGPGK